MNPVGSMRPTSTTPTTTTPTSTIVSTARRMSNRATLM
jgi:hypothetical protein